MAIPTYGREEVLVATLRALRALDDPGDEILVIDQTSVHEPATEAYLSDAADSGALGWIRLGNPSIPGAMNAALRAAAGEVVLFLDDDVLPGDQLVREHRRAHGENPGILVAGQVLQPGEEPTAAPAGRAGEFRFHANHRQWVSEFPGGNFSVRREEALAVGGFDERFVRVAYRFEREFADRYLEGGGRILFEPAASIRHLKAPSGGTRTWGDHLRTVAPSHSVGAYYYVLTSKRGAGRFGAVLRTLLGSVATRFHLRHPWWIPPVMFGNLWAILWAIRLRARGQALVSSIEDHRG